MISAGVWLLLGVVIAVGGSMLQFGTWERPGPGFLPTLAGVALAGLAGAVLLAEWRAARERPKAPAITLDWSTVWRLVGAIGGLFAYGLLLLPLGFVLTTLLVLGFFFRGIAGLGWGVSLGATVATTLLSYLLFSVWLKVPFPPGPWHW